MGGHRPGRVADVIRTEISRLLQTEIKDPRVGFVSIVKVEVSSDLRYAKVYVSVLGDAAAKQESLAGLASAGGFIRSSLGGVLSLRHMPELRFVLDDSIEHGARIARLLEQSRRGGQGSDEPEGTDSHG